MSVEKRPYVGTWSLNNKQVYQHSPDCLVYLNGDVTIPNAVNGNRETARINFQPFITQVSVDAGTQPGSGSASISLSIPVHSNYSFVRDANFIFRPGLEVHIYMRGYFAAKGMFNEAGEAYVPPEQKDVETQKGVQPAGRTGDLYLMLRQTGRPDKYPPPKRLKNGKQGSNFKDIKDAQQAIYTNFKEKMDAAYSRDRLAGIAQAVGQRLGLDPDKIWAICNSESGLKNVGPNKGLEVEVDGTKQNLGSTAWGISQILSSSYGGSLHGASKAGLDMWWEHGDLFNPQLSLWSTGTLLLSSGAKKNTPIEDVAAMWSGSSTYKGLLAKQERAKQAYLNAVAIGPSSTSSNPTPNTSTNPDQQPKTAKEIEALKVRLDTFNHLVGAADAKIKAYNSLMRSGNVPSKKNVDAALKPGDKDFPVKPSGVQTRSPEEAAAAESDQLAAAQQDAEETANATRDPLGPRDGSEFDDIISYPYYHVFHGVVTEASLSYSGGFQTASLNCSSMLHFWQYHQLASSASYFGARPTQSKLQVSLIGHPFTGKHPYEIIYTLFHDTAGAAGGVGFALSQKTNQNAKIGGESLFSLNIKYWERRFQNGRMMKLRLFGANGQLFNSLQSAYLGRLSTTELGQLARSRFPTSGKETTVSFARSIGFGNPKLAKAQDQLAAEQEEANATTLQSGQKLSGALTYQEESAPGAGAFGLADMQAFVKDIGLLGQVNLFETTYQSKLDIVQEVLKVTGFEFFQDVDGDFVFKPPFYNMDSSTSRIYRIEDIDLISFNMSEKEPQVTYSIGKGSHFKNVIGVGVDNEWGVEGRYIDWRLVAQFGWRPDNFEAMYFTNPRSLFYASVNRIDIGNVESSTASATIPLRPEIRVGYPFYIVSYDCYYYCNSFSHSWAAGGQCTTSLQLIGKRSKFFPPGDPTGRGIEKVNLANTTLPPVTLEVLDDQQHLKLAGFPNVVMALDPNEVNPLFFLVQDELTDLSNPVVLQAVVKIALAENLVVQESSDPPGVYTLNSSETTKRQKFIIGGADTTAYSSKDQNAPFVLTVAADRNYQTLKAAKEQRDKDVDQKLVPNVKEQESLKAQNTQLSIEREKATATIELKNKNDAKIEQNLAKIKQLEQDYDSARESIDAAKEQQTQSLPDDAKFLLDLLNAVGDKVLRDKKRIWGDLQNTSNLLELLSDKKANFNNSGTPGSYRYFSCSHPDPDQQGLGFQFNGTGVDKTDSKFASPLNVNFGFTETPKIARPDDPKIAVPEAELKRQNRFVKKGLWIQRSAPYEIPGTTRKAEPFNGTYRLLVSTAEIQTLEFGVALLPNKASKASAHTDLTFNDFSAKLASAVTQYLDGHVPQADARDAGVLTASICTQVNDIQKEINEVLPVSLTEYTKNAKASFAPKYVPGKTPPIQVYEAAANAYANLVQASYAEGAKTTEKGVKTSGSKPAPATAKKEAEAPKASAEEIKAAQAAVEEARKKAEAAYNGPGPNSKDYAFALSELKSAEAKVNKLVGGGNAKKGGGGTTNNAAIRAALEAYKSKVAKALNGLYNGTLGQSGVLFENQPLTKNLARSSIVSTHVVNSPIFPVSDEKGYRVLGTYRYGRGIKLMKDSLLDQLTSADPKSQLSPKALDLLLRANSEGQKKQAVKIAVEELSKVFTVDTLIDLGLLNENSTISDNAYRNFVADQRDSTQQVPATNAAYSLADLGVYDNIAGGTVTRGAEADVATQAFSFDFVNIVRTSDYQNLRTVNDTLQSLPLGPDGQPTIDKASQYQAWTAATKAAEWEQRQDSLRGTLPIQSQTTAQQVVDAVATFGRLVGGEG